jgi:hypothetical protein
MDVSYAAEAGAVLDALLAAISATDTDEGEGGEGTLRAFESLDEWRAFVQRLVSKQAFASCVIDFPFADATDGGLNLLGDKRLLERMYCFHDPEADVPSDWGRQEKRRRRTWLVVVHVHTLLEWGVCKKWKEAEPLREVTSVNVRHATWVARSGGNRSGASFTLSPRTGRSARIGGHSGARAKRTRLCGIMPATPDAEPARYTHTHTHTHSHTHTHTHTHTNTHTHTHTGTAQAFFSSLKRLPITTTVIGGARTHGPAAP